MKKLISILLSVIMLSGVVLSFPISTNAIWWPSPPGGEGYESKFPLSEDGLYYYTKTGANTVEFTSVNGLNKNLSSDLLEIPSTIDGYTVTSIGEYAFSMEDLSLNYVPKKLVIPDTVTIIKDFAFASGTDTEYTYHNFYDDYMYDSNLKTVVIPDSVVYIGNGAFAGCENLEEVTLPKNLLYLGESAFFNCESLKKIVVPASIMRVRENTFKDCFNLEEVVIEKGIRSIEKDVFARCRSLKKITVSGCLEEFETEGLGYYTEYKKVKKNTNLKIYIKETLGFFNAADNILDYARKEGFRSYVEMNTLHSIIPIYCDAGESVYLKVAGKKVKSWKSSKPAVAKITSNGKFTSLTKGITTITATLEDSTTYSRTINVRNNPSMSVKTLKIKKGQTKKVTILGKADGVNNVYKSTTKAKIIGSVKKDYFKVKGLKKGETTLKVTVNGKVLKLKVKVKAK